MNRIFILACYAFISLGVSASMVGPALPTLASHAQITLDQAGYLFTSMAVGYILSAPTINGLRRFISTRMFLIISPWLVITCMILLAVGRSFAVLAFATFLLGLGQSGTQVSYIAMFGSGKNASGVLNRLNAFFGVGALVGPLLASLGYTISGEATLAFMGAALSVLPLPIGILFWKGHAAAQKEQAHTDQTVNLPSPWHSFGYWMMLTIMGLYVGAEVAFTGWVTEFTRRSTGVVIAQAAFSTSAFYIGMAISRYILEYVIRWITPINYVALLLLLAIGAMAVMVLSNALPIMVLASFAVGYGAGPIYPTLIAVSIHRFPRFATLITSTLTSAGSVGAIILPATTGILITQNYVTAWLLLISMWVLVSAGWLWVRREDARQMQTAQASQT